MQGLWGPSCESLALWLSERVHCAEDVSCDWHVPYFIHQANYRNLICRETDNVFFSEDLIFHECTSGFAKHLFEIWLPDYDIHRPTDAAGHEMLLSPHQFGWPLFRPRLYTVLSKRSSVTVSAFGETLSLLFRKCMIPVSSLFVASQDSDQPVRHGVKTIKLQLRCLRWCYWAWANMFFIRRMSWPWKKRLRQRRWPDHPSLISDRFWQERFLYAVSFDCMCAWTCQITSLVALHQNLRSERVLVGWISQTPTSLETLQCRSLGCKVYIDFRNKVCLQITPPVTTISDCRTLRNPCRGCKFATEPSCKGCGQFLPTHTIKKWPHVDVDESSPRKTRRWTVSPCKGQSSLNDSQWFDLWWCVLSSLVLQFKLVGMRHTRRHCTRWDIVNMKPFHVDSCFPLLTRVVWATQQFDVWQVMCLGCNMFR